MECRAPAAAEPCGAIYSEATRAHGHRPPLCFCPLGLLPGWHWSLRQSPVVAQRSISQNNDTPPTPLGTVARAFFQSQASHRLSKNGRPLGVSGVLNEVICKRSKELSTVDHNMDRCVCSYVRRPLASPGMSQLRKGFVMSVINLCTCEE
jgi:hypothetical protein